MNLTVVLPALTAILALVFSLFLIDQWLERRRPYQLVWTLGMLFFGIAAGCEALAAANGWAEPLYRTWYLTGAVWTAGWLGLGTAFLLGRTRFGYTFAACLLFAGLIMFALRNSPKYADAGSAPILYFIAALILAIAVGVETYFANERWPRLAALAVVGATGLSIVLDADDDAAPAGLRDRPGDRRADGRALPRQPAAPHPVHERHRRARAGPRRGLLDLRVHAQAAGPRLLARPEPAGRPVPVQPAHRPVRDHRELRRLAARWRSGRSSTGGCNSRVPATRSSPSAASSRR